MIFPHINRHFSSLITASPLEGEFTNLCANIPELAQALTAFNVYFYRMPIQKEQPEYTLYRIDRSANTAAFKLHLQGVYFSLEQLASATSAEALFFCAVGDSNAIDSSRCIEQVRDILDPYVSSSTPVSISPSGEVITLKRFIDVLSSSWIKNQYTYTAHDRALSYYNLKYYRLVHTAPQTAQSVLTSELKEQRIIQAHWFKDLLPYSMSYSYAFEHTLRHLFTSWSESTYTQSVQYLLDLITSVINSRYTDANRRHLAAFLQHELECPYWIHCHSQRLYIFRLATYEHYLYLDHKDLIDAYKNDQVTIHTPNDE